MNNTEDYYMDQANSNGYSAFVDIEKLGNTLDDDLLYVGPLLDLIIYPDVYRFLSRHDPVDISVSRVSASSRHSY